VSGSSSSLIALETSFQQDINGDGAIGLNQSIIEGFGSTQLSKAGSNYYVSSGASTLSIKYSGTPIYQGQFGIWTPIAAEQTGGGYSVVLKYGSSDQYLVWSIDSNGNYISNTAPVSGSSSSLTALETSFQQDINGDGTISGMALGNTELFALPKGTVQPVINANSAQSDLFEPTHQNDHLTAHSAWHLL
jgi:serralysin